MEVAHWSVRVLFRLASFYLRRAIRILVIWRLLRHLLEHLVETHVYYRVAFDEPLKLLDDQVQRFVRAGWMLNMCDLLVEPTLENVVVLWKPAAKAVMYPAVGLFGCILFDVVSFFCPLYILVRIREACLS